MRHSGSSSCLQHKEELLRAGQSITWRPPSMLARYENWVENLAWDWCISRQRYYGVPFPLWYCEDCGEVLLADPAELARGALGPRAHPALQVRQHGVPSRDGCDGYLGHLLAQPPDRGALAGR